VDFVEVHRLPDRGRRDANIIDSIRLAPLEYSYLPAKIAAGIPIETGFVGPRTLRLQVRIADVGGIAIVEIGEARHAEGVVDAGAELCV
jgi:hypothetical protein